MPKYPEETINVSLPLSGRWVWTDESQTVEFISFTPGEEGVLSKRRQTLVNFKDLQRAECLAEVATSNHRGRQSIRKKLSHAHLKAETKRQEDHVTIDDVKQVAVSLLQENYSHPIPSCFLAVLKTKEINEVLTVLLLYLSCFFEHKSLENKPKPVMAVDLITERQVMAESLAKKKIAEKKLAVSYFTLIMNLEVEQHQHKAYRKGRMSNTTEWLLHVCLYRFFCYVVWVTFGRKDLRDIQEEVGRLLYSDTFNTAMRSKTDGGSGVTSTTPDGSVKTEETDPKETGSKSTFKHRRRPPLSSIVNQRSPLMVSLLPSPKEQSPHLFVSSRTTGRSPTPTERCDTEALTEELDQQLASVSFGILGKPLDQFSRSTLVPYGEQRNNRDEDERHKAGGDVNNNSENHLGSRSSFTLTGADRFGSITHINSRNSAAVTAEAVTLDAQ